MSSDEIASRVLSVTKKKLDFAFVPVILKCSLSLLLCHMMMSNEKATVKAHVQRHAHAVFLYLSTHKHTKRQAEQAKSKRNDCPGENQQCFFLFTIEFIYDFSWLIVY